MWLYLLTTHKIHIKHTYIDKHTCVHRIICTTNIYHNMYIYTYVHSLIHNTWRYLQRNAARAAYYGSGHVEVAIVCGESSDYRCEINFFFIFAATLTACQGGILPFMYAIFLRLCMYTMHPCMRCSDVWTNVCMYVCTYAVHYFAVQHLYILAEMYGVVCILTMCSYSTKYFLYMVSVPIHQIIGT